MTLIEPLEPEFGVGDINANIMPTLSLLLMTDVRNKETDVATLKNMAPDPSPKLGVKSELVDNVIPVLFPAVTGPSLSPVRVTTTSVDAATTAVAVVTTIAVADGGAAQVPLTDPLINTLGVAEPLKKPGGYVNVILLPMASAPPAVVVKLNVAAAELLPATRSDVAIANEGLST